MTQATTPLAGVKVIELGSADRRVRTAASVLAQFGAEVIKVESPGERRSAAQVAQAPRRHLALVVLAEPQQEVGHANLKAERARDIVRELVADADIVIENFRPGMLEEWGLGWDDCRASTRRS